jgi:hypothetical protein
MIIRSFAYVYCFARAAASLTPARRVHRVHELYASHPQPAKTRLTSDVFRNLVESKTK